MNKTERAELKSIVRQQFRVLRKEVAQRQSEVMAETRLAIAEQCEDDDRKRRNVQFEVDEIVRGANRAVNDVLYREGYSIKSGSERVLVGLFASLWGNKHMGEGTTRDRLDAAAALDLQNKVSAALSSIDRQEADLLRDLAIGALESEDARAFMAKIPTVGELVPSTRLAELERALDG